MCGRFTLIATIEQVKQHFGLTRAVGGVIVPRYNIAPGQPILAVQGKQLNFVKWGYSFNSSHLIINSRLETASSKKLFSGSFKRQRCLVVGSGFFEWKTLDHKKIPYYFRFLEHGLIGFAGIMLNDSCVILTTELDLANTDLTHNIQFFHNRIPVIIKPDGYDLWLDPTTPIDQVLNPMLQLNYNNLTIEPVSSQMNNPKFDNIVCIKSLIN